MVLYLNISWVIFILWYKKIFIIHNFGPVAELPTSGNGKCSCVMCFSKDVPGGPEGSTESKEASDMMGKATWVWWDGGGSTGNTDAGWVVAGGPIHPSILISAFAWPDPFGNSKEERDHYKIVFKWWPMLIIYGWCSRNTLLKMAVYCLLHQYITNKALWFTMFSIPVTQESQVYVH